MAKYNKSPKDIEKYNTIDKEYEDDRHNKNARVAAALEPTQPRINPENL
ncbi:hypothetical protein GCM10008967_37670 [Bacillus carboniphilus]|uniref:Uncharacterized protein n=1 Tax=Bacillus carboniphilus TaxID=86663 RepID=A0ABP3GER5_9BACI